VHWVSLIDWQTMRIRYSEPDYINEGEWTALTFDWIDYRYRNKVVYPASLSGPPADANSLSVRPELPAGQYVVPVDAPFGTGNLPDKVNKTWTVSVISYFEKANITQLLLQVMLNTVGANATGWAQYAIDVYWIQCPPNGCAVSMGSMEFYLIVVHYDFLQLPAAPNYGNATKWSDPMSWITNNFTVPKAGQDVLINASMYMYVTSHT
jgi:hypothetical protein